MFCKNCGAELKEGARFCDKCGAQQSAAVQQKAPAAGGNPGGGAQGASKNNNLILIVGCVAVLAVVILLVSLLFGGGSYKKPIKRLMAGIQKEDPEKVMDAFPEEMIDEITDMQNATKRELGNELIDTFRSMLDLDKGDKLKISYKITDTAKYDRDELEDLRDDLDSYYDIDAKDIKAAKEVDVEIKLKSGKDKEESEDTLTVVKIGRKWYIVDAM